MTESHKDSILVPVVELKYLAVRECADAITANAAVNLQDKLNATVSRKMSEVDDVHRVVSVAYTATEGLMKRNCALATVWYEAVKGVARHTESSRKSA